MRELLKKILKKNTFDIVCILVVVFLFLFIFISNMVLLYTQSEIKKDFTFFLDRTATKDEIARWIHSSRDDLSIYLSSSEERGLVVNQLFTDSLARGSTEEEKTLFYDVSIEYLADHLFLNKERIDTVKKQYWDFVGRPPSQDELFFHIRSKTAISKLQNSLNNSKERVLAIQKTYHDTIGRSATAEEVQKLINDTRAIDWIRIVVLKGK